MISFLDLVLSFLFQDDSFYCQKCFCSKHYSLYILCLQYIFLIPQTVKMACPMFLPSLYSFDGLRVRCFLVPLIPFDVNAYLLICTSFLHTFVPVLLTVLLHLLSTPSFDLHELGSLCALSSHIHTFVI